MQTLSRVHPEIRCGVGITGAVWEDWVEGHSTTIRPVAFSWAEAEGRATATTMELGEGEGAVVWYS
jgi:hypothetical protein